MYISLHVMYLLSLSDFNEIWILSTNFKKILKYQISWKFVQWEHNCSMQIDGRMEGHDKINNHFSQFCKHTKKQWDSYFIWTQIKDRRYQHSINDIFNTHTLKTLKFRRLKQKRQSYCLKVPNKFKYGSENKIW
jgi:hypothetical protein